MGKARSVLRALVYLPGEVDTTLLEMTDGNTRTRA